MFNRWDLCGKIQSPDHGAEMLTVQCRCLPRHLPEATSHKAGIRCLSGTSTSRWKFARLQSYDLGGRATLANGCPQLGQAGYLVTYWSHRSCRENIHSHPWSRQKDCHYAEMVHNDWQRQITLRDHFAKTYRSCQETRETTPGISRYHYTDRQAYLECPRP